MRTLTFILTVWLLIAFTSGCSTLFSNSLYPVMVRSNAQNVQFEVFDCFQNRILTGVTPQLIVLPSSYLPFIRQRYTVLVNDPDYESAQMPVTFHIDGWYFANLFIPPLAPIAMLIIDPLSGRMFTIDNYCRNLNFNLRRTNFTSEINNIDDMPHPEVTTP